MAELRVIPSIDLVMSDASLAPVIARCGRPVVVAAVRDAVAELRRRMTAGTLAPRSTDAAAAWIAARAATHLAGMLAPGLRSVINATGVIIHTNLGRAPLSVAALDRVRAVAADYSNLEYDLSAGGRGQRHVHVEQLLMALTGASAAAVVNNNAAATLLVLAALARGREVIVSRGELVEIGGGFRVPDVMAQSGATLREVGTTNRTRVADYAAAISDKTALILRVHPSNFRIDGFAERPALDGLVALAREFHTPLFEDIGSGWLGSPSDVPALRDEPSVAASIAAGVDLVSFSGDKLVGGPQSGLIVGRADLMGEVRSHPLMRAMRADKLTYAALESTLQSWLTPASRADIPVFRMLTATADEIRVRAERLAEHLRARDGLTCSIREGVSTTGGGSSPQSQLATWLVTLAHREMPASALERALRNGDQPVVARIVEDEVAMDLRTVLESDDWKVAAAIEAACRPSK